MNLEKDIEKCQITQKLILPIMYDYKRKRDLLIDENQKEQMRTELRKIKEKAIDNIEELKKKAIKNLEENGINVIEVKDKQEFENAIKKIIGSEKLITKSKSNVIKEIEIEKMLKDKEILETDLGDFIVQISDEKSLHPVTPGMHLTPENIVKTIKEKFDKEVQPTPEAIAAFARQFLRDKIYKAKVGLTGANVISADGSIFILENEGNISLISRIVDKHIVVTGWDKIVENREEAQKIVQASSIFASGQNYPVYVSIISGPSKTADIQKKLIIGAQGAKEVHLILLDNKRSDLLKTEFEELLYCINCGACVNLCPVYHQIFTKYGSKDFSGPKGVITSSFREDKQNAYENGAFFCTSCKLCKENCPVKIDLSELIKKLRKKLAKEKIEPENIKEMIENTKKYGNPFGEIDEKKTPDKFYCC